MEIQEQTKQEVVKQLKPSDMKWMRVILFSFMVGFVALVATIVSAIFAGIGTAFWTALVVSAICAVFFISSIIYGTRKMSQRGVNLEKIGHDTVYGKKDSEEEDLKESEKDDSVVLDAEVSDKNNGNVVFNDDSKNEDFLERKEK